MNQYLLFDLDGTLSDSAPGIKKCVQYALESFGIHEEDDEKLSLCVGPPLKVSFMEFWGLSEEDAEKAIIKYRERYKPTGIYENSLFPGIKAMLATLKRHGATLAVASSKPEEAVHIVLDYFGIEKYFDVIVGSLESVNRITKEDVIEETLRQLFNGQEIEYDNTVMIGDRKYDVQGAKKYGLTSVAVTYDGSFLDELKEAGADYIVFSAKELEKLLLRGRKKGLIKEEKTAVSYRPSSPVFVIYDLIIPIAVYYTGYNLLNMTYLTATNGSMPVIKALIFLLMAGIMLYFFGYKELHNARYSYCFKNANMLRGSEPIYRKNLLGVFTVITLILAAILFSLGFNVLFTLTGITQSSQAFEEVSVIQQNVKIWEGILIYGICSPIAEELVFRGILFNRLKNHFKVITSVLVSGLFFGVYHGNLVQGLFGLIAGILFALVYEKSGSLFWPILLHGVINLVSFAISVLPAFAMNVLKPWVCATSLLCMIVFSFITIRLELKNKGID